MPKNRDYTGLERTPSSMAWLIGLRAKLRGQLDRYRAQEAALPEKIRLLEVELSSLDAVIPMHAVKVDPTIIVGKKPQRERLAAYGALKRSLIRSLKAADGESVTSFELVMNFVRENEIDLEKVKQNDLMHAASRRLCEMVQKGLVRRCHSPATNKFGSWAWIPQVDEG